VDEEWARGHRVRSQRRMEEGAVTTKRRQLESLLLNGKGSDKEESVDEQRDRISWRKGLLLKVLEGVE
jgi:hypothetical protein